jgi:uncharacterized membrane protein YhaH (DUF805 family)
MSENTNSTNNPTAFIDKLKESEPQIKKFSWTPFALILICFSLPFLEVSCQGQKIASFSGFQTAFGTQISSPNGETKDIPGTFVLVLVLVITVICLLIPFLKLKFNNLIATIGSVFSLLLLLITKVNIDNESFKQGGGLLLIQVAYGYVFIFCLFILGGLTHGFLHQSKKKKLTDFSSEIADEDSNPIIANAEPPIFSANSSASGEFDIVSWVSQNKSLAIIGTGIVGSLIFVGLFFYGSFWLFFSRTPESDAKTASANYCSCEENYNSKLISLKKDFLNSFDGSKFKTREEAEQKLQKLENSAEKEFNICNSQAKAGYAELRNRYLQNKVELERFEKLFEVQKETCNPSNQLKLSEITDQVEEKISNMKIVGGNTSNTYSQSQFSNPQNLQKSGNDFRKNYIGTINYNYEVVLFLERKNEALFGKISPKDNSRQITVNGVIDESGTFYLKEFDNNGNQTGIYKGVVNSDGTINGNWMKPDESGERPISFKEIE